MSLQTSVTRLFSVEHPIVAQGAEAGGHGGGRATLPFVPIVVDFAAPTPVLAAAEVAKQAYLAALERGDLAAVAVCDNQAVRGAVAP